MMDQRPPGRNAELGLSTRAIHHGYDQAEENGALTPPIFMTSTYAFESAEAGSELFRGERAGYICGSTRTGPGVCRSSSKMSMTSWPTSPKRWMASGLEAENQLETGQSRTPCTGPVRRREMLSANVLLYRA